MKGNSIEISATTSKLECMYNTEEPDSNKISATCWADLTLKEYKCKNTISFGINKNSKDNNIYLSFRGGWGVDIDNNAGLFANSFSPISYARL